MSYKINHGRVKSDKKVSTFGKVKKPFKSSNRNRKGNVSKTMSRRNPLDLRDFYVYVRDIANLTGCDSHHWLPRSKLRQDIFLSLVPYSEHREIHAGGGLSPASWALEKGFNVLVEESMTYFYEWCLAHDIAKDFIFNNRGLQ